MFDAADNTADESADTTGYFNSETGRALGAKSRLRRWVDYKQALDLQESMVEIVKDGKIKAGERASSARVWVDLFYARRVMLGLGDPKSVPASNDPTAKPKRKRGQSSAQKATEPTDLPPGA